MQGVEHLLRDVKDSTVSNLTSEVSHMASGLRALKSRLTEVQQYLNCVLEGQLPVNHDIMYGLQVTALFPNFYPQLWPRTFTPSFYPQLCPSALPFSFALPLCNPLQHVLCYSACLVYATIGPSCSATYCLGQVTVTLLLLKLFLSVCPIICGGAEDSLCSVCCQRCSQGSLVTG